MAQAAHDLTHVLFVGVLGLERQVVDQLLGRHAAADGRRRRRLLVGPDAQRAQQLELERCHEYVVQAKSEQHADSRQKWQSVVVCPCRARRESPIPAEWIPVRIFQGLLGKRITPPASAGFR